MKPYDILEVNNAFVTSTRLLAIASRHTPCAYSVVRSVVNLCARLYLVNKSLSRRGPEIYFFSRKSRPSVVHTQHPIQWAAGTSSPAVKRPGREADCLLASSVEVCNEWDFTSAPLTCLGVYIDSLGLYLYLYLSN